jgi:hypothetical protein
MIKFAKIIFWIAAVWGFVILTPLYFIFDSIGRQDPPPITHPAFYYGFVSVALAWQIGFVVIARDPVRFRPMMIPAVVEKFGYGISLIVLYLQHRLRGVDVAFGGIDLLLGVLFLVAFARTGS